MAALRHRSVQRAGDVVVCASRAHRLGGSPTWRSKAMLKLLADA